jgi:hypothetical protein
MSIFAGQIRQLNKRKGERMRFLVIVKASKDSEAGKMQSEECLLKWASSTRSWQTPV